MRRLLGLVTGILSLVVIGTVGMAFAATGVRVRVAEVRLDDFPNAKVWFTVWDASGRFVAGIQAKDVALKEDGAPRQIVHLDETHPGVQGVIAVQPGRAFSIHDNQGVSRFQYISNQIVSWLDSHPKGKYDLSLYTADGTTIAHTSDLSKFRSVWLNYHPNFKAGDGHIGIRALSEGMKLAAAPTPYPAMGRALLWITPLPAQEAVRGLAAYRQQAMQFGIRVYVWLVAPTDVAASPEVKALTEFAEATGGRLTLFSGVEVLPTLDQIWGEVNHAYRLIYKSAAVKGREHTLELQVRVNGETVDAPPFKFSFSLQPPRVTIGKFPSKILLKPLPGGGENAYTPSAVSVRFSIGFPDGHPRALKAVELLVDGKPVARCTKFPCTSLQWDLTPYTHTAFHTIAVKVQDQYGLASLSKPTKVQIVVTKSETGIHAQVASHRSALVTGVVVFSGLVLLGVLLVGILLGGRREGERKKGGFSISPDEAARRIWRLPGWHFRHRGQASQQGAQAIAYLVPLSGGDEKADLPDLIPIVSPECTIGSDPAQATIVVKHPSVSPTHARLWRSGEGAFYIADRHSEAGTWVNYAPVSTEGSILQPGDLVHIGKVGFRFRLQPERETKVLVKPL